MKAISKSSLRVAFKILKLSSLFIFYRNGFENYSWYGGNGGFSRWLCNQSNDLGLLNTQNESSKTLCTLQVALNAIWKRFCFSIQTFHSIVVLKCSIGRWKVTVSSKYSIRIQDWSYKTMHSLNFKNYLFFNVCFFFFKKVCFFDAYGKFAHFLCHSSSYTFNWEEKKCYKFSFNQKMWILQILLIHSTLRNLE